MKSLLLLLFTAALCGLSALPASGLTAAQKLTIEQITSVFENGTAEFRYDYIEDIDDRAGITCGRVGFTVGELLLVTDRYVKAKGPGAPLAAWLPCLRRMGDNISKDYSCLFPSVPADKLPTAEFKKEVGLIARGFRQGLDGGRRGQGDAAGAGRLRGGDLFQARAQGRRGAGPAHAAGPGLRLRRHDPDGHGAALQGDRGTVRRGPRRAAPGRGARPKRPRG